MLALAMSWMAPATGKKKQPTPKVAITDTLSAADSQRFNYFFIESVRQQMAENYAAAFDLLRHCLTINPHAAEAYFLQAMYYSMLNKDSLALSNLETAVSLRPDNSTYIEKLANFYINAGNYQEAINAYEQLAQRHPDRTDVLNVLVKLYQQEKDYDKMISTIDRIEQVEGSSEDITLSKMNVYEMKGDKKSAFKVLQKMSQEHPNDVNYKVMMGNWLMQNKGEKQAFKIFSAAEKEEPDNLLVQSSLYDYYQATHQEALADEYLERIVVSPKTETKSKVTMLRQFIQQNERQGGDSVKVLSLFDKILKANPKDADMAELRIAYMSLKNMPEDTLKNALVQLLDIAPDNASARLQLLQYYWEKQDWDKVITYSEPATEYNPDEMVFYYFTGLAYYQKKDSDKALDAFRKGIAQINSQSNGDMVSDMYASVGYILQEKERKQEAYAAYDSCLQWKPDNVECLNNYAYYLSVEGDSLQKAEQMSYRTIKAEPKNSTFLDTYAWILFKQERYVEARIYIDQALANDTDSVVSDVILEHAGDIYACLNNTSKALEYWQQSLKAGNESELLPRKIKLKKYISPARKDDKE